MDILGRYKQNIDWAVSFGISFSSFNINLCALNLSMGITLIQIQSDPKLNPMCITLIQILI